MALTKAQLKRLRATEPATGNRIEAARRMLGLTQIELAEATGRSQVYISAVERGKYRTVTVDSARPFASAFGCSIEDLFPSSEAVAS